jgi:hypothetical protein
MKKIVVSVLVIALLGLTVVLPAKAEVSGKAPTHIEVPYALQDIDYNELQLLSDAELREIRGEGWVSDVIWGTIRGAVRGCLLTGCSPWGLIIKGLFGYAQPVE